MVARVVEAAPLVGRRRELATIRRLIEGSRLVTLVGVGGAGKTRLARRATADLSRSFQVVCLVELAPVEDPALLGHTVATALGMQVGSADWRNRLLADFLGDRRILLTLDNCEHLIEACAQLVDDLLYACPGVRILATSQRGLGLANESIYSVPPLSLPALGIGIEPRALLQYESVALFVERATALQVDFELSEGNAQAVVELCQALDGVPLAIELAAARIRVLSPAAMVDRLGDRYQLLSRGYGGRVPDRQRSLEASVQWTWDLCAPEEQRFWARVSVFRGGFSLEAAEEVCGDGSDILDLLAALVDKSVLAREDSGDLVRFQMLETLRLYGERQLEQLGESDAARMKHRDHMVDLVAKSEEDWTGPRQVEWMWRLRRDHSNLRAALQWSLDRGDSEEALRLVVGIEGYWTASGTVSEARRWLGLGLALRSSEKWSALSEMHARSLRLAAWFALMQVDFVSAESYGDEIEWLSRGASAKSIIAEVDMARGVLIAWQGDPKRAITLMERSVKAHGELGHHTDQAFGLVLSGLLLTFAGATERARTVELDAVSLAEEHGETYMRSFALAVLGLLAIRAGDLEEAERLLRACIGMKRLLDDRLGTALVLEFLSWHAVASGQPKRAATLRGAADGMWQQIGVTLDTLPFLSLGRAECERAIREALTDDQVQAAIGRGEGMGDDASIEFALEGQSEPAPAPAAKPSASPLTRRESEVAGLVAAGLTNAQIADRLVISTRTAETHVENILRKLGFTSRASIASWAAEQSHP